MNKLKIFAMLFCAFVIVSSIYLFGVNILGSNVETSPFVLILIATGFIFLIWLLYDLSHPIPKQTRRFTSTLRFCDQPLKINADIETSRHYYSWCGRFNVGAKISLVIENVGTKTVDTRNQKVPLILDLGITRQLYRVDIVKDDVTNPELIVGINDDYAKLAFWDVLLKPRNPLKIEMVACLVP